MIYLRVEDNHLGELIRPSLILVLATSLLLGCKKSSYVSDLAGVNQEITAIEADREMEEIIAPYRETLSQEMEQVICSNDHDMMRDRPESDLGNFFSDACLSIARSNYEGAIDAAMFNFGSLRATVNAGDVTVGDIYELMPFENELVVLELPYSSVVAMMDYLAKTGGEPVADIQMTFKAAKVISAQIAGKDLEEKNYHILTTDYLAGGGDNMVFFKADQRVDYASIGIKVRDGIMDFCRDQGAKGTVLDFNLDGRIKEE